MDDAAGTARREWLVRMAASGALGGAGLLGVAARALAAGDLNGKQGVVRLEGTASVAGRPARVGTSVALGDRIATGPGSQAVIVLGQDAFLMRSSTVIETTVHDGLLANLLVSTGKVLSVFSKKPLSIKAANATIGIRGTGCYIEVDPASVYFCLCYGEATVDGPQMAGKLVKTTHHESPLLLTESGGAMRAEPGGFKNHTDAELILLESLVGREPPFLKSGAQYPAGKY
jgi:hypothetical protein